MNKPYIKRTPGVKEWVGMNIINAMMYYKEELKRERGLERRDLLQRKLEELKAELHSHKVA